MKLLFFLLLYGNDVFQDVMEGRPGAVAVFGVAFREIADILGVFRVDTPVISLEDVALSTDKACAPINLYGATKLTSDKLFIAANNSRGSRDLHFSVVRYGNVMGSRGSVIPLGVDQIKAGKPITITNPEMTRFMMTLDDAVDLVIYAWQHGMNGDLFVQKSPAATLVTLATALKELYNSDAEVRIIGTRHGEKLYETLVTREEMAKAEDMGDYFRIPCDTRDLNYDKYFKEGSERINEVNTYHSHNTRRLDVAGMKELLKKLKLIRQDLGLGDGGC